MGETLFRYRVSGGDFISVKDSFSGETLFRDTGNQSPAPRSSYLGPYVSAPSEYSASPSALILGWGSILTRFLPSAHPPCMRSEFFVRMAFLLLPSMRLPE